LLRCYFTSSTSGSREARGPTRRSDTGTVRHATDKRTRSAHRSAVSKKQVRSRRAVIEQSSSDSDQSEDGKVQLLSKRSPQKRRKRVRRSVKKVTHIVKTPSRESSVDTVETVAMLAGDEEDGAREVESVMDVSSQNDEAKREARERSSGAEGSTELERWAESIGVSSSSSSIRCCYSPPAESTGSEATEKSFDRVVMTGEQIAESENITSKHETEEGCNEDGEDRRSLSRCDVELAVNNDDELPPTLEADGDMPLWHRSPVDSPEPVVMEVSFATSDPNSSETGGSGEGSHSPTEMPQLRASAAGTESIYDGEDEDAPPRLSPNFAPTEVAEENSLSGSETIPQWADGGTTVDGGASLKKRSIRETVDSSPPHLARSSSTNTPPKSLLRTTSAANNTCEMVNLGGDAGSEGDTSESEGAERVPRASLDSGSRTVCEVATLDAEPSALDRPPKAPAMLTQPIEEHEGNSFGDGPNTFAKKRPQPLSSAIICGQPRSNVSERSPVAPVNAPLSGGVSSQHFMSPAPCSIQQHTPTGPHQCLTPHQQTDMCNASPGSSVYLSAAAPEGAPLHSSPTTPLRIASQQPHEASAFGSPSVSKRCDEPTMQQPSSSHPMVSSAASSSASKTTPTPVVAPALSQPPLAQNGQRRGTSKKELNRCAKQQQQSSSGALMVAPRGSMQASAAPVAPTTAVAPYMLATPATHQQMTHQLGASAHSSHSQPPAAYYQGSYGHAGSASTHFESQFYAGSFAASGSTAGSYAGTPAGSYPMNMVTMAKSHSVSTAMHNSFSYNYQSGIQPTRSAMLGGTGAQSSSPDSSPAMLGTQCAAVQNGNAAASASWRYANSSAAFGGNGFMDAFGGGVPPSGGNGQFPLPNQLYPQQYYSYLMPMMRND
uniref:BRCT domain-containing protein n=1 Tax=Toxocara canis TaxID=6265 RepID=A0A183TVM5_TOXCA